MLHDSLVVGAIDTDQIVQYNKKVELDISTVDRSMKGKKMRNTKMIVTDLDRTLLRTDKTISEYSISVFERLRKKGIKIVFATARPVRTVTQFTKLIQPDAAIYHNGAVVHHMDKSVEKTSISPDEARKVLYDVGNIDPDMPLSIEINDTLYANFDVSKYWKNIPAVKTDFSDLPDLPVDKIIAGVTCQKQVDAISQVLPSHLYVEVSENVLALVMHKEATKHKAVKSVAGKCGIDLNDIVAFGDDYNDLYMLQECGTGVAVKNAIEQTRKVADDLCDICDKDGVARWIEEKILK